MQLLCNMLWDSAKGLWKYN